MSIRRHGREWPRLARVSAGVCGMVCAAFLMARAASSDQPVGDAVGIIEGEDIAVTGPMSVEVVGGQTKTILRSGSDVRVKSGRARISLVESGQISICGPAHLSVLKAGGSLTIALDSGVIHVRVEREPGLVVYTPQIQAQPVAVGDDPRDLLVGFESSGVMCVRTYRGAMRLEQQLTGQSVMVPQGGDVLLTNGQIESLRNGGGHCACELQMAKVVAPALAAPIRNGPPTSVADEPKAAPETSLNEAVPGEAKQETKDEPIYQVYLPPLRFDATAKVQPEPDPRLMVIVRRVRVRPTLVFQGRVEGEPPATVAAARSPAPAPAAPAAKPPAKTAPPAQGSVVDRMRSFFRRLWSSSS